MINKDLENYQYKFNEISFDYKKLCLFPDLREQENELLIELRGQLMDEVYNIINEKLTSHQKEVIYLHLSGLTEKEIGKRLWCNQPSVHKNLYGNIDYRFEPPRRHGGAVNKLKKWCMKSEKVREILKKIEEIYE